MKNIFLALSFVALTFFVPPKAFADGGVYASGGGTKTAGQTFTVTVTASGATFDSLQGTINISGPVDVISFSPGNATWLPGKTPSNGGQFVGIASETNSLTVATIKLRGKSAGSGAVSVSGTKLASKGNIVGSGAGSASFTIQKAPDLPSAVNVTSSTHPDQNSAYEATTVTLNWNKENGTTGFSYLFDQAADTTPAQKVTDANTTATYANQAIGTYYFHIRAQNGDGWGPVTHFKVTIKEPEAKIDESLAKPSNISVKKASNVTNDIKTGTLSGIIITGKTEPGFTAQITLDPEPTIPEGKSLSAIADSTGKFELLVDFPLKSGFYKLTIQGQKDKTLTPVSDPINFEISQKSGGAVTVLSDTDINEPAPPAPPAPKKWFEKINYQIISIIAAGLWLITLAGLIITLLKLRQQKTISGRKVQISKPGKIEEFKTPVFKK